MIKFITRMPFVVLIMLFMGCGNQGNSGNGNTVYVDASTKASTPGAVFANISGADSGKYTVNDMAYTFKSIPYPGTTKIPSSDIEFTNVSFSYAPINTTNCTPPTFNPANINIKTLHLLPAGGSVDIEAIPIFYPTDMIQIYANAATGSRLCQYDVTLVFNGTEVNTGVGISKAVTTSAYVSLKK